MNENGPRLLVYFIFSHLETKWFRMLEKRLRHWCFYFAFFDSWIRYLLITMLKVSFGICFFDWFLKYCTLHLFSGVPEVACLAESAKIAVQTAKPFLGHVYVKGQFRVQGCHLDLTANSEQSQRAVNLQAARPTIIYEVPYRGCVVKRERTVSVQGVS